MGLSADRAYKLQSKLKVRLLDIISMHISCKSKHEVICKSINDQVMMEAQIRRAPARVLAYLQGIKETRMDDIYRYHLVWCMSVDGNLYTSAEMNTLSANEIKVGLDKDADYRSPWARCDGDKSTHVWKDEKGNVLKDKPYYIHVKPEKQDAQPSV
jgi:hypothetical protein